MSQNIQYPLSQYCIIRTYASGVWCAVLEIYDPLTCHAQLADARRLWSWEGAFTLSSVALNGVRKAKMPAALERLIVARVEEIIPVTEAVELQLRNYPIYQP